MRRIIKDEPKNFMKIKSCETQRFSKGHGSSSKEIESKKLKELICKQKQTIHDKLTNKSSITRLHLKQSIKQNRQKRNIGMSKVYLNSSQYNYESQKQGKRLIAQSQNKNHIQQGLRSYRYQSMDINDQIKINRNQIICRYKTLESERNLSRNQRGIYQSHSRLKKYENNEKFKQKSSYQKHHDFFSGKDKPNSDEIISNRQVIVCSARELNSKKGIKYEKSLFTQRDNVQSVSRIYRGDKKCRRVLTEKSQSCKTNERSKIKIVDDQKQKQDKNMQVINNIKKILTPQKQKTKINSECNSLISSIVENTRDRRCSVNISRFNQESILENIQQIDKLLDNQNKQNVSRQINSNNNNNNNHNSNHNNSHNNSHNSSHNNKDKINKQYFKIKQGNKLKKVNEMDCFSSLQFIPMIPSIKMQVNNSRKNCRLSKNNPLIMKSIDKIRHIFPKGFFYKNNIQQILN